MPRQPISTIATWQGSPSHHPSRPRPIPASVREAFHYFDVDGSGFLDHRKLRAALRHYGVDTSARQAAAILQRYDKHPDGQMELFEFNELVKDLAAFAYGETSASASTALSQPFTQDVPASVRAAFHYFDVDGSGFLDHRELRAALRHYGIDTSARQA